MNTHYQTHNKFAPLLATLLLGSVVSTSAVADLPNLDPTPELNPNLIVHDAKTYPGITCEAQATQEITMFRNYYFGMANNSPGYRGMVCPIVRDNTKDVEGTLSSYVNVYNPSDSTFECSLYSLDRFGGLIDSYTNSTSAFGDQIIYLDVDTSIEDGHYGINCSVPYGGMVYSYEVREFLTTDEEGGITLQLP